MDIDWLISNSRFELSGEDIHILSTMADSRSRIDFTKTWTHADITFIVEGKPIYANKMVLALWSPVFEAMFGDNFREKNATEIKLPGKVFDDMVELMVVLHPPNKEICEENVVQILPLLQEYQIDTLLERTEEFLMSQASSVRNYLLAEKFNLVKLLDSNLSYLKRAPITRIKNQPDFDQLDQQMLIDLLMDKCEKFETNMDALREVRQVLERKKPTTFPGMTQLCDSCTEAREQQVDCPKCMKSCLNTISDILLREARMHLLCEECTGAREQQVDCDGCMKSCCKKITEILRGLER